MPQELQVLTCYQCETFQVQIVTKVRKWTCKMCGEKQSLKKVYFRGTGKECREIVQDLNAQRMQIEDKSYLNLSKISENSDDADEKENDYKNGAEFKNCYKDSVNKWNDLITENEDHEEETKCESEKYTFKRKGVKRKAKKVKEAYACEDYSNQTENDARCKRSKQENYLRNKRNTEYESDYSENDAEVRKSPKNYHKNTYSERTYSKQTIINVCETSTSVPKLTKWAEDLENQSDEEIMEESFKSESEISENDYISESDISENNSQERLQRIQNKSDDELDISCSQEDEENVDLFDRVENSSPRCFEKNASDEARFSQNIKNNLGNYECDNVVLSSERLKRNNGGRNLENIFEDNDEDLDLGI